MFNAENMSLPRKDHDIAVGESGEYLDIAGARHLTGRNFALNHRITRFCLYILLAVPLDDDALRHAQNAFALVGRNDDVGGHAGADTRILAKKLQDGLVGG